VHFLRFLHTTPYAFNLHCTMDKTMKPLKNKEKIPKP